MSGGDFWKILGFFFFVSNDMYSVCCLFVLENFAICAIKKVAKMFAKFK
jgi:hypothetical protein